MKTSILSMVNKLVEMNKNIEDYYIDDGRTSDRSQPLKYNELIIDKNTRITHKGLIYLFMKSQDESYYTYYIDLEECIQKFFNTIINN